MIIVSQNKNIIINFDNVPVIAINDRENSKEIYALTNGETDVGLGIYATKERAKEVLQEIISRYEYAQRNLADSNDTSPFNEVFVYKMPLE